MNKQTKWDLRYMQLACKVAEWSEDANTKIGAVIVSDRNRIVSLGYNGLPQGVAVTEKRLERPEKYKWFEHAERNAIYNAAQNGVQLVGSTMYITSPPCTDCARAIIQSGIKRVVMGVPASTDPNSSTKAASIEDSLTMFNEAGVLYEHVLT